MDETLEFCVRVLGPTEEARTAAAEADRAVLGAGGELTGDRRVVVLSAASQACRARGEGAVELGTWFVEGSPEDGAAASLAAAVAREMTVANAALPERQREALALREAASLSHEQIGTVMGVGAAAVASLLSRARLRLRAERRGELPATAPCDEWERSLRLLALRLDGEPMAEGEDEWLTGHLRECEACEQAHAAVLEASACYRSWEVAELGPLVEPEPVAADEPAAFSADVAPMPPVEDTRR
jgi:DNA-directed RNA polymerase specialized sigma24 family protein